MHIRRVPLRVQVHEAIVQRILRGGYEGGARVTDTQLSEELGVSRTPVREAFLRLEREGIVRSEVGKGFFVRPLTSTDVDQVFPIVAALEEIAVRSIPSGAGELGELDELARRIDELGERERERIDLGLSWHRQLVVASRNPHLVRLLDGLAPMVRRYAHAYWRHAGDARVAAGMHTRILDALRAEDPDRASAAAHAGWERLATEIRSWIDTLPARAPEPEAAPLVARG